MLTLFYVMVLFHNNRIFFHLDIYTKLVMAYSLFSSLLQVWCYYTYYMVLSKGSHTMNGTGVRSFSVEEHLHEQHAERPHIRLDRVFALFDHLRRRPQQRNISVCAQETPMCSL